MYLLLYWSEVSQENRQSKKQGKEPLTWFNWENLIWGPSSKSVEIAEKPSREFWQNWRWAIAGRGHHPKDWKDKGKKLVGQREESGSTGNSWSPGRKDSLGTRTIEVMKIQPKGPPQWGRGDAHFCPPSKPLPVGSA